MRRLPCRLLHHQKSAHHFHPLNYGTSLLRRRAPAPFVGNLKSSYPLASSMAGTARSTFEYIPIEDVERMEYYRPGGYHRITIGDKLHARYRVVHKLGYGSYSTTWLASDDLSQRFVAVKVGTAESSPDEAEVMSALTQNPSSIGFPGRAMITSILESFQILGPNGIHHCYVTAPARASLSNVQEACNRTVFQIDVARALDTWVAESS